MNKISAGENRILLYYFIMLLPLVLITTPDASYSMIIRLGYFGLLVLPLISYPKFTPFVFLAFYGFCDNACSCFLPDSFIIRFGVLLALLLLYGRNAKMDLRHFAPYLLLYFYALLICLVYNDTDNLFIKTAISSLLLVPFIQNERDISRLALGFVLMAVALSVSYYINFKYFAFDYGISEDYERGSWQNLNVLGAAIGCGLPLVIAMLMDVIPVDDKRLFKIPLIASGVFILITILSVGSRGAFISSVSSTLLLLLFSNKLKKKNKIRLLVGAVVVVATLFYFNFFDLLFYRMTNTDYSGTTESFGGRGAIWTTKIAAFSQLDFASNIFGIGRANTTNLGVYYSTHNDYVTALVAFGYIGLLLFLSFLLYPIFKGGLKGKKDVVSLLFFLMLECMVVEPFFRGYFLIWVFYIMINKMAFLKVVKA